MPQDAKPLDAPAGARRWTGPALVMAAALGFSFQTVFARLSYETGANVATVLALRGLLAVAALYVFFRLLGRSLSLTPRMRLIATGIGVIMAIQALGLLGAVQYIPVTLTILIFYTFPVIIAVAAWLVDKTPLTPLKVAALVGAFAGLALALNVSLAGLDPHGVGLAALGAFAIAASTLISARVMRGVDPLAVAWQMIATAAVLFWLFLPLLGGIALPHGPVGWLAFLGSASGFTFGAMCFYSVLVRAGATRVAVYMNFEPLFTIALAVLVLGESLAPVQILGGAIVIASIMLVRR